jgi:hypothetical protein
MSEQSTKTNVPDFIGELNAGILIEQLGAILSEAALNTVHHGKGNKKGKVSLEFTLSQIGENEQVIVCAKLSKSIPTQRGKKSEENITDTPMFVGRGGQMTIDQPKVDDNGQFGLVETDSTVRRIGN